MPINSTTLTAVHAIAAHPGVGISGLFALEGSLSHSQFQSSLAQASNDSIVAINHVAPGLKGPSAVAIDAAGNAWVASDGGAVVKIAPDGTVLSGPNGITGGGLSHSFESPSTDGHVVANKYSSSTNGSITEMQPNGTILSGAHGYTAGGINYPLSLALDPRKCVGRQLRQCEHHQESAVGVRAKFTGRFELSFR